MGVCLDVLCSFSLISWRIFQDSSEPEILGSERSVNYVWDDLTLPHKLVVQISGKLLFFYWFF